MSYAAGIAPAGIAPVGPYSTSPSGNGPAATNLDLEAKDAVLVDGQWQAIHYVDQQVQNSFGIELGTLSSAPDVGHTLRQMRRGQNEAAVQDAKERVRRAYPFSRLVTEGAVDHIDTRVTFPKYGEVSVVVDYYNLILDPSRRSRRTAQVAL